jgi:hypothetical protein
MVPLFLPPCAMTDLPLHPADGLKIRPPFFLIIAAEPESKKGDL